jgi:hypothetical protein
MDRNTEKCSENWIITVESTEQQHQEIILSAIANRAHQMFEDRGCKHERTNAPSSKLPILSGQR